jgi:hypothetical protein
VNEQQQADHELVWEYSGGTVTPRPECHAPPTADCRIEWVCGCETWGTIDRDEDGRPFHLTSHVWNNGFQEKQEKHYGKPGAECNVVVWMENDDELIEACVDDRFTIGRTSIEPVFTGDYYEWKPLP